MKFAVLLAGILAGFAFATPTLLGHRYADTISPNIPRSNEIFSQPFSIEALVNGAAFSQGDSWMMADDFTAPSNGVADYVEIWAVYTGTKAPNLIIQFREDVGDTGPGAILSETVSSSFVHTNTGYSMWGYQLWKSDAAFSSSIPITQGTIYWLALQTTGGTGSSFWLCTNNETFPGRMSYFSQDNGTNWSSSLAQWGVEYTQFFTLTGTLTALNRSSWGSIKTLF